ncbi:MAG: hypothetical protein AB9895_00040 [Negativicutes bacterium]
MGKIIRSWSKPDNIPNLIGRKNVDWSVFEYGSHIPIEFIEDFEKANDNIHVDRGTNKEVTLIVEGNEYKVILSNVDRKGMSIDTLQIRYDSNKELKNFLQEKFKTSYDEHLKG